MTQENQTDKVKRFLSPEAIEALNITCDTTKVGAISATANENGGLVVIKNDEGTIIVYDSSNGTSSNKD